MFLKDRCPKSGKGLRTSNGKQDQENHKNFQPIKDHEFEEKGSKTRKIDNIENQAPKGKGTDDEFCSKENNISSPSNKVAADSLVRNDESYGTNTSSCTESLTDSCDASSVTIHSEGIGVYITQDDTFAMLKDKGRFGYYPIGSDVQKRPREILAAVKQFTNSENLPMIILKHVSSKNRMKFTRLAQQIRKMNDDVVVKVKHIPGFGKTVNSLAHSLSVLSQDGRKTVTVKIKDHRKKTLVARSHSTRKCRFCGEIHQNGKKFCSSFGKICEVCSKINHNSSVCWYKDAIPNTGLRKENASEGTENYTSNYSNIQDGNSKIEPKKADERNLQEELYVSAEVEPKYNNTVPQQIDLDDFEGNEKNWKVVKHKNSRKREETFKSLRNNIHSKIIPEVGEKAQIPDNEASIENSEEIEEPTDKILWFRDGSPNETEKFVQGKIDFLQTKLEMYKSRQEEIPYKINLGDGYQWSYGNIIQKMPHAGKKMFKEIIEIPITERKISKDKLKSGEGHLHKATILTVLQQEPNLPPSSTSLASLRLC